MEDTKVKDFTDVCQAFRHTLHLCILLANQHDLIRNSYTLRICMIQHLFLRVIGQGRASNHVFVRVSGQSGA